MLTLLAEERKRLEKPRVAPIPVYVVMKQCWAPEFGDSTSSFGGETNNIEEYTNTSLFANGFESKSALYVPIHVLDVANVLHELRLSAMVPPPAPPEKYVCMSEMSKKFLLRTFSDHPLNREPCVHFKEINVKQMNKSNR